MEVSTSIVYPVLAPVSRSYPRLTGRLPTCYSPVRRSIRFRPPEGFWKVHARDLHVLGTPPAFVLSQDQTLQKDGSKRMVTSAFDAALCHSNWNDEVAHSLLYPVFKVWDVCFCCADPPC